VAETTKSGATGGSFSPEVKTAALVACKRFCCLCEKPSGVKMHCHHIVPVAKGGNDTAENCIPLCLNCHAEVEAYNDKHPLGNKFKAEELKQRRDVFYKAIKLGPAIQNGLGIIEADRVTFADIQKSLPSEGNIRFIRDFSFGYSFRDKNISELEHFFYERKGPEYEFLDEELEAQRKELLSKLGQFIKLSGTYLFRPKHDLDSLEVPDEWELSNRTLYFKALKDLGSAADLICEVYDALIRLARRKLA
jgi:HNH endonuclease